VARLFTDGRFTADLRAAFAWPGPGPAPPGAALHLSPPGAARFLRDPDTGLPRKLAVPMWAALPALRLLAAARRLRGTPLDPFRGSADRRLAAGLLAAFEADVARVQAAAAAGRLAGGGGGCGGGGARRYVAAAELLEAAAGVRGFGHVRERAAAEYGRRRAALLEAL
jgi:indolepyruvate ferredoxin oxidoreductase